MAATPKSRARAKKLKKVRNVQRNNMTREAAQQERIAVGLARSLAAARKRKSLAAGKE